MSKQTCQALLGSLATYRFSHFARRVNLRTFSIFLICLYIAHLDTGVGLVDFGVFKVFATQNFEILKFIVLLVQIRHEGRALFRLKMAFQKLSFGL